MAMCNWCGDEYKVESVWQPAHRCDDGENKHLTDKEFSTIVFALEEYQEILDKENAIDTRNYVMELIWKVCAMKEEVNK